MSNQKANEFRGTVGSILEEINLTRPDQRHINVLLATLLANANARLEALEAGSAAIATQDDIRTPDPEPIRVRKSRR